MIREKVEHKLLEGVELLSRRDAKVGMDPQNPWPDCLFLLHQPQRPTSSRQVRNNVR